MLAELSDRLVRRSVYVVTLMTHRDDVFGDLTLHRQHYLALLVGVHPGRRCRVRVWRDDAGIMGAM